MPLWNYFSPFIYFSGQHGRKLSQGVWTVKLRYLLAPELLRQILYMKSNKYEWLNMEQFSKSLKLRLAAQTWLGSWKLHKTALGQANCESIIFVFKEKKKRKKKLVLDSFSLSNMNVCLIRCFIFFSPSSGFPPSRELHDDRKAFLKGQWERGVVDGWFPFLLNGN